VVLPIFVPPSSESAAPNAKYCSDARPISSCDARLKSGWALRKACTFRNCGRAGRPGSRNVMAFTSPHNKCAPSTQQQPSRAPGWSRRHSIALRKQPVFSRAPVDYNACNRLRCQHYRNGVTSAGDSSAGTDCAPLVPPDATKWCSDRLGRASTGSCSRGQWRAQCPYNAAIFQGWSAVGAMSNPTPGRTTFSAGVQVGRRPSRIRAATYHAAREPAVRHESGSCRRRGESHRHKSPVNEAHGRGARRPGSVLSAPHHGGADRPHGRTSGHM